MKYLTGLKIKIRKNDVKIEKKTPVTYVMSGLDILLVARFGTRDVVEW